MRIILLSVTISFTIFVLSLLGCSPQTEAKLEVEAASNKIVFSSGGRIWNDEIYVMDIDGSNRTRLTRDHFYDSDPDWSQTETYCIFINAFQAS